MFLHVTPFVGTFGLPCHHGAGDILRRVWNRIQHRQGWSAPPTTMLFHRVPPFDEGIVCCHYTGSRRKKLLLGFQHCIICD